MPLANDLRRVQQQRNARLHRRPAPRLECIERGLHRLLGVLRPGLLVNAHYLRRPRRIKRLDLALGPQAMSADDQVVFVPQVAGHQVQCRLHLAGVFRVLEVGKRLIAKLALGRARLNFGRESHSCHSESIVVLGTEFSFHRIGVEMCPQRGFFFAFADISSICSETLSTASSFIAKTNKLSQASNLSALNHFYQSLGSALPRRQPGFQQFRYIRETNPPTQGSKLGTPGSVEFVSIVRPRGTRAFGDDKCCQARSGASHESSEG